MSCLPPVPLRELGSLPSSARRVATFAGYRAPTSYFEQSSERAPRHSALFFRPGSRSYATAMAAWRFGVKLHRRLVGRRCSSSLPAASGVLGGEGSSVGELLFLRACLATRTRRQCERRAAAAPPPSAAPWAARHEARAFAPIAPASPIAHSPTFENGQFQ